MKIWKYELGTNRVTVEMPTGAQVLTAQLQHRGVVLWALVDPDAEKTERTFHTYMTGHLVPDVHQPLQYISTVQAYGGDIVAHVFEIEKAGDP